MRKLVIIGSMVLLAGCADTIEQSRNYAAQAAVRLIEAECALSTAERQKNREAVQALLDASNNPALFLLYCAEDEQAGEKSEPQ